MEGQQGRCLSAVRRHQIRSIRTSRRDVAQRRHAKAWRRFCATFLSDALVLRLCVTSFAVVPLSSQQLPVRQVASGVYVVLGDSGRGSEGRPNAGFIVTGDGVVVIDALASPAQGELLVRTIRTRTAEPIRWLVLPPHHPDHHFGAVVLRRAGARAIAHPDVSTGVDEQSREVAESAWTLVVGKAQMAGFAYADGPDRAVVASGTLQLRGETDAVSHASRGAGHTAGDLIVWLPAERVLFAGDLLIEDG